jgi:hypothetical protein
MNARPDETLQELPESAHAVLDLSDEYLELLHQRFHAVQRLVRTLRNEAESAQRAIVHELDVIDERLLE